MSVEDLYRMDSQSTSPTYMPPPMPVAPMAIPVAPMPVAQPTPVPIPMGPPMEYQPPPMEYQVPSGGYQAYDPNAPTFQEAMMEKDASGDSLVENMVEFGDPLGFSSYDDVGRAWEQYKAGDAGLLNLMIETVGALPVISKIKYLEKALPTWMWNNGIARPVGDAWNKTAGAIENLYGPAMPVIKGLNKGDAIQDMYEDNVEPGGLINTLPLVESAEYPSL